ncbi:MAG: HNH endonuclease [Gammaproteobacteria bacterium]
MRFWWVNQNQTFAQESKGGFLWSPKRKANDQRNPFYEFMREVAPGDVIFSFVDTRISAIGIAQSTAYEAPKPAEFGAAGPNWSAIGWKIAVRYFQLENRIRPADYIRRLMPLMPSQYAPLQASGRGNQGIYLTSLPDDLAHELIALIGPQAQSVVRANRVADAEDPLMADVPPDVFEWEEHLVEVLKVDRKLSDTQREAVVLARRGQGLFKRNVQRIETRCRITGVSRPEHLLASHCKPWRDCETYDERIDGENGLLLTPSIDHLFDRGLISFEDSGKLLISPVAHRNSLQRMGVPIQQRTNVGTFSQGQRVFLEYHRERVFLQARR